jgi:hypothetical protein
VTGNSDRIVCKPIECEEIGMCTLRENKGRSAYAAYIIIEKAEASILIVYNKMISREDFRWVNKEKLALLMIRPLLYELENLHSEGVIHADIKLDNALVFYDRIIGIARIQLCDFGLSEIFNQKSIGDRAINSLKFEEFITKDKLNLMHMMIIIKTSKNISKNSESYKRLLLEKKIDQYWDLLKQDYGIEPPSSEFNIVLESLINPCAENKIAASTLLDNLEAKIEEEFFIDTVISI